MTVGTRKAKVGTPKLAYPGLWSHPKTGIYWFRLIVPKNVQDALGRKAVIKTLGTRDPSLAVERWGPLNAEWREKIRAARSGDLRSITDHDAWLIGEWLIEYVEPYSDSQSEYLHPDRPLTLSRIADMVGADLSLHATITNDDGFQFSTAVLTPADRTAITSAVTDQLFQALKNKAVLAQDVVRQAKDKAKLLEPDHTAPAQPGLRDAFNLWKAATEPTSKTASEFEKAVDEFIQINGDLPLASITGDHFRAYRGHLRTAISRKGIALSRASRHKRFAEAKAIIAKAVDEGWLSIHPGFGVTIERGEESSYRQAGWLDDEFKLLFQSPVYSEEYRPEAGGGEAAYWLPILGMLTGARESELAQLNVADVIQIDGVWCLHFRSSIKTKQRVKNKSSERIIPLHSRLIELGFLRYVRSVDPDGRLFPLVRPDSHGQAGGLWSRWFSRYRKEIGLGRDAADFHALRHGAVTKLREGEGSDVVKDRITGHSSGKVGASYGSSSKAAMKKLIDQIKFKVAIPKWRPGRLQNAPAKR